MSVDCIVADDNPLLDFLSIKNLNLNLSTDLKYYITRTSKFLLFFSLFVTKIHTTVLKVKRLDSPVIQTF